MGEGVLIDIKNYNRLAHFNYFKDMAYPYVGLTCDVDITDFYKWTKEKNKPFFLSFLWCVGRAANSVKEFRQRIAGNSIIEYTWCYTSHTVAMEDGTYSYCNLNPNKDFEDFVLEGTYLQEKAKLDGNIQEGEDEAKSLLFISTIPWVSYTSIVQPVNGKDDSNPRITWGRFSKNGENITIPVSVLCHHALVDGIHIGMFYRHLEETLSRVISI